MQPDGTAVAVRMFGSLELDLAAGTVGARDLGGVKPKQLLEQLLLERGRPVSKDRLADQLWGEQLPQRVAATIETYVSVLRRHLGPRLISTEHGGYRVPAEQVSIDTDQFDALLRRAAGARWIRLVARPGPGRGGTAGPPCSDYARTSRAATGYGRGVTRPSRLSDRPLTEPHPSRLATDHPRRAEILAAHAAALAAGEPGYLDPDTGLFVLTARYLADRGSCCGSGCRHCPYTG